MPARIAITGASGRIGSRVARLLADRGIQQRLVVRDEARAPDIAGCEVAVASGYADRAAMKVAFAGIDTVFLVSATEAPARAQQHREAVDAAYAAAVRRIVYLSFFGADPAATFTFARDHWSTEQHIRATNLAFTFLRDNLYADFLPSMVGDDGVIRGPAGDGLFAPVAQWDVAEAAAAVLAAANAQTPGATDHDGKTYSLTGPDLVSMSDVAQQVSEATDRPVRFHDETVAEAYASRAKYGAPQWQVEGWVSTYQAIAAGELAPVSDDVESLIGRAATPLSAVLTADR